MCAGIVTKTRSDIEGAGRCNWRMRLDRLLTGSLVAALVALMPLAHASPPDPSWIAGFYDAADHDEVVLAVTDALGYPVSSGFLLVPAQRSREHIIAPPGTTVFSLQITFADRAPPSSVSPPGQ